MPMAAMESMRAELIGLCGAVQAACGPGRGGPRVKGCERFEVGKSDGAGGGCWRDESEELVGE